MPADFVAALDWIFSAILTLGNVIFSHWLLTIFAEISIFYLVWKIYDLLR